MSGPCWVCEPATGGLCSDLFRPRLDEQINMKPPLMRLAGLIDWGEIRRTFAGHLTSGRGRPALLPRPAAGRLTLPADRGACGSNQRRTTGSELLVDFTARHPSA